MKTQIIVNRINDWFQIDDLELNIYMLSMRILLKLTTRRHAGLAYDRVNLAMGILNRRNKVSPETNADYSANQDLFLNESEKRNLNEAQNLMNYTVDGLATYNFVRAIRTIDGSANSLDNMYERMMQDSVISSAVDMYVDDALQVDPQRQSIFWVELDTPDDYVEDYLSKGLTKELERFLKDDLRMDKELRDIAKRVVVYGDAPVKLDFVDEYEDDKLQLIDVNKKQFESVSEECGKILKESADLSTGVKPRDVDYNSWVGKPLINKSTQFVHLKESLNNIKNNQKILNESVSSKKAKLYEDELVNIKRVIKGRWYAELLGSGSNIYTLRSRGKILAYIDRNNVNQIIDGRYIVNFSNNTGKNRVTFEVGDQFDNIAQKKIFTLSRGESYLENSRIAWQVLSALEDILLLTRMTRSILYRIFSVEVGQKGNKETKQILDALKSRIKIDETVNVRDKLYNSELKQVPLGDSIFIPTRNGIGVIDVKVVGGDVNLRDAIDLDYFKDKLFAGLKIPKSFLGFEQDLPGGLGNTSLTRMDIRYGRTVKRLQSILAEGLKDLCDLYLRMTRPENVYQELPAFKVVFTSINTSEDAERIESKQVQMETLDKVLETLKNMGIDLSSGMYEETRNSLIKEWFGSDILDLIEKDEKNQPINPNPPADEGGSGDDFSSTPVDVQDTSGGTPPSDLMDFGNEEGTEEDNTGDVGTEENNTGTEETSGDDNVEAPEQIPYELK